MGNRRRPRLFCKRLHLHQFAAISLLFQLLIDQIHFVCMAKCLGRFYKSRLFAVRYVYFHHVYHFSECLRHAQGTTATSRHPRNDQDHPTGHRPLFSRKHGCSLRCGMRFYAHGIVFETRRMFGLLLRPEDRSGENGGFLPQCGIVSSQHEMGWFGMNVSINSGMTLPQHKGRFGRRM